MAVLPIRGPTKVPPREFPAGACLQIALEFEGRIFFVERDHQTP
jgi:hypothetical protein